MKSGGWTCRRRPKTDTTRYGRGPQNHKPSIKFNKREKTKEGNFRPLTQGAGPGQGGDRGRLGKNPFRSKGTKGQCKKNSFWFWTKTTIGCGIWESESKAAPSSFRQKKKKKKGLTLGSLTSSEGVGGKNYFLCNDPHSCKFQVPRDGDVQPIKGVKIASTWTKHLGGGFEGYFVKKVQVLKTKGKQGT